MASRLLVAWLVLVVPAVLLCDLGECKCDFEAIFNFGDSNIDTGGFWAAFPAQGGPYGLQYCPRACCGYGGTYDFNQQVFCGNTKTIDGQNATASACGDPYNYVSWDGIHATEAANKLFIAEAIISGV